MQSLALKKTICFFFTKNRFGVDLFFAMNPLWRYYSFLHFTLAKKHNLDNLIKQIKKSCN